MRMLRHLLTCVATVTMAVPVTQLHAEDFADSFEILPRCPDDAAANRAPPLDQMLTADEIYGFEIGTDLTGDAIGNVSSPNGVEVQQGDRRLRADQFKFDKPTRRIDVSGKVRYSDPKFNLEADAGSLVDGEGSFEGARFQLPLVPARGAAEDLSLNKEGVLTLTGVQYTTCPDARAAWQIKAKRVSVDTRNGVGTARDARVEFFGVPIMRLPYISFPVGNARKSGLLFPSIGTSSNSGVQLSVPYYFNIAPNQDLTLTPTWYTTRGIDLDAEYRFLTRSTRGEIRGNILPDDRKTGQTRTRIKIGSSTELPRGWRIAVDAENVSDARYFEDFAQGADGASIAFLPRRLQLSYRDDNLDVGAIFSNFQTLDQDLADVDQPHTEIPRLYASGNWLLPGKVPVSYGADTEFVLFQHRDTTQGWRFDASPQVGLDYEGAGYFLKPAIALETTHYQLKDLPPGSNRTPGRTLPVLSLDSGLQFERDSGRRGQRRMTLEPRLMYLYVPYRDQSQLPVFDTAEPDLNWIALFRDNRYAGIDRVSDANQLSAGLTTHLYSSKSGTRFLATTIGQTFYFHTPRVRLPDEPAITGHVSDLIAQVELQAFKNWNVSSGLQWDRQNRRSEKGEMLVRYQPESRSVVNLGYRFQRDRLEQIDFSAAWPVSEHWRLYGRSLYSLRDSKSIERFTGFEFSSCCWNLRAVARDYVGRRSGERDRSFYLQLELKGLSNVGQAADAFLSKAIRGYSTSRQRY